MSARSVIATYWAGMALLVGVALAAPAWSQSAWALIGAIAAGGLVGGAYWHRPNRAWPWVLLAGAMLVSTGADLLYAAAEAGNGAGMDLANLAYLAVFVISAVALLRFARSGSRGLEQAGLLDALAVTLVFLLLIWVTSVSPRGASAFSLSDPALVAYPIGDALLLATAVRLLTARRRSPTVMLLAAGAVAALVGNLVNGLAAPAAGWVADLGWLLFYVCWGGAALHPGMTRLTAPDVMGDRELTLRRLWVVGLTAMVPPAILLVEAVLGRVRDGIVLAVGSAALFLFSLARIAATANSHRRSLIFRERHDTLTGLANRAHLVDRVAGAVAARRDGQVGLLLLDLDQFRLVNDSEGQSVGDEVLVAIARRLVRHLAPHDVLARFGGDEFAILVGALPPGRDIPALCERIVAATKEPVSVAGRSVAVSACVGLAIVDGSSTDADGEARDLLRHAGLALQAAKSAGPGEWCRYESERHEQIVERMRLREALSRAVTEGSFHVQYQPIVVLDTGATIGFEALVRWEHPTRGLVAPAEFIALAEETGLIESIGDLVLRTAVAAAVGWGRTADTDAYVSVNVSARQFRTPGLAERVERVITAAGLPPSRLMLEITESLVLREEDHVLAELATLRNIGVRLAIDDFGTGFSSLSYLEQTPIDVIKIDKSFAGTLVASDRQRTVVEGVVRMAEKLGLQVVAEGVETVAQRGLLTEMRCPYGQGYLWAEPLDDVEASRWLATQPVAPAPPAPTVLTPWPGPVPRPAPPGDERPATLAEARPATPTDGRPTVEATPVPPADAAVAAPIASPLPGTMPP